VLRIALAQHDFPVGAVNDNGLRLQALRDRSAATGADLLLTPELALSGYPPEDLLFRPGFQARVDAVLAELKSDEHRTDVLVGHPARVDGRLYNCASWLSSGTTLACARKQRLPNYTVFDEKRYFTESSGSTVVERCGTRIGVLICEDAWFPEPAAAACADGAELLLVLNASPYHQGKRADRQRVLAARARENGVPLIYCNLVGGQDDLLFDGQSMLFADDGALTAVAPAFSDHLLLIDVVRGDGGLKCTPVDWPAVIDEPAEAEVYRALVRATGDYVRKNGFQQVLLGLSGGIDSALTLAIAVDALGAERVSAVRLPSRYTSALSNDEALAQAREQGVRIETLPIEAPLQAFIDTLAPAFAGRAADITEENLQARCRGVLLMALSNKFGGLLLTTGNKSEMAVGYSTIYGDMCGGFAPIKDVYKTEVYALARWRNTQSPVIPQAVIDRAPSAELRENQTDQDSLPPYAELDDILRRFIENDEPRAVIVAAGHDPATVARVTGLVLKNEYKRRQSAPGPRVTARSFGRDRRFPISSGYR
jgi:NAD+ synthase (glutamine-hydrolysing)